MTLTKSNFLGPAQFFFFVGCVFFGVFLSVCSRNWKKKRLFFFLVCFFFFNGTNYFHVEKISKEEKNTFPPLAWAQAQLGEKKNVDS